MLQGNIEPLIRFNLIGSRSSGVERQLRRQDNQGLLRLRPPDRPSARSVRKNGSCKMGEAAERAAASPKERQSSLFELARNAAEGRVEIGAEGIDHENNRSSDACCDQAIFDRRCARFIPSESNKQSTHVGLLYWLATRNSCTSSYYGQVNSYRDYCDISPIFHDPPQRSRGTDRAFAGSFVEQGRLRERNSTAARLPIPVACQHFVGGRTRPVHCLAKTQIHGRWAIAAIMACPECGRDRTAKSRKVGLRR
jgi:hypothetical protein